MDPSKFSGKTSGDQIGEIWKYLDHLAQNDPEKYSKFVKKTLEDGEKEGLGPPEPFFSVRTHKVPKTIPLRDFYINACKWKQVPPPKSAESPIPMTASELREELIKGKICYVVDVALNNKTIEECVSADEDKEMLINILIKYVEAMNKCKLNEDYKMSEKDYMGNKDNLFDLMCPDALKNAAKESTTPLTDSKIFENLKKMNSTTITGDSTILDSLEDEDKFPAVKSGDILLPGRGNNDREFFLQESKETNSDKNKETLPIKPATDTETNQKVEKAAHNKSKTGVLTEPSYSLKLNSKDDMDFYQIDIDLHGVETMKDCDVDITEDSMHLLVPGKYELHMNFERKIDEENSDAVFVRKTNTLMVKLKCL